MPYKSDAQRRYFNANRSKLEGQGVDVDEWNESSKGKKLPEKAKEKEASDALRTLCQRAVQLLGQTKDDNLRFSRNPVKMGSASTDAVMSGSRNTKSALDEESLNRARLNAARIVSPELLPPARNRLEEQYNARNRARLEKHPVIRTPTERIVEYKYPYGPATSGLIGAGIGGLTGGLKGLIENPGEDEQGNKKSRIRNALQSALLGAGVGAGIGAGSHYLNLSSPLNVQFKQGSAGTNTVALLGKIAAVRAKLASA